MAFATARQIVLWREPAVVTSVAIGGADAIVIGWSGVMVRPQASKHDERAAGISALSVVVDDFCKDSRPLHESDT